MLWKLGLAVVCVLLVALGTVACMLLRAVVDTMEEACAWLRVLRAEARVAEKPLEWHGQKILLQDTDDRPRAV